MGLFRNKQNGGIMDVIRCDETSYLIWKWHPKDSAEGASANENAIRWGSSLRVKNGEVAVFVYNSNGKMLQDHIVGPYDSILKTDNLPIITSAIGLAYNGNTPFQAEVYFINLSQILQIKIGVPYFDVADPRFPDRGVPTSVRGVISFKIEDYIGFIDKYQLRTISIDEFRGTIKAAAAKYVKNTVANAPDEYDIPVTQLEKRILDINAIIEKYLKERLYDEFGVTVTSVDISDIEIDKTSANYKFLIKKTDAGINLGVAAKVRDFVAGTAGQIVDGTIGAAAQVAELSTDTAIAAVDVKEYKYAKHKKSQIGFVKSLFHRGEGDLSAGESRPGFSTNVSNKESEATDEINSSGQIIDKDDQSPPPLPNLSYHVAVDGKPVGPLSYEELTDLVNQGKLTPDSLVWKKGMEAWTKAKDVEDFSAYFTFSVDDIPPIPDNK